jgi:hypothetical protein
VTRTIEASITAYSTAVAPASLVSRRRTQCRKLDMNFLDLLGTAPVIGAKGWLEPALYEGPRRES